MGAGEQLDIGSREWTVGMGQRDRGEVGRRTVDGGGALDGTDGQWNSEVVGGVDRGTGGQWDRRSGTDGQGGAGQRDRGTVGQKDSGTVQCDSAQVGV